MKRSWVVRCVALCSLCAVVLCVQTAVCAERSPSVNRVGSDIRYLASDELEGRGPGTDGLEKASRYIVSAFDNMGLRGAGNDGAFVRPFTITLGAEVVKSETFLVLHGPAGQELSLKLGEQYQPLTATDTEKLEVDLAFAGYGIAAPQLEYDDYQDADVKGKAVIVIRREPQQDDEESVFDGRRASRYSYIRAKTQAAQKAGAAVLILVNDPFTTSKENADQLSRTGGFGRGSGGIPFVQLTQGVVNQILATTPVKQDDQELASLAAIEERIDESLKPLTQSLEGWTAELQCVFETSKDEVSNVAAVIDGEGPLAQETIVIGAHYDHLGFGPYGSRRPNARAVHNGADDNATGTAAVLELARRYAARTEKPARRLVFIAFTAEERGLLGSNHYLQHPLYPLDQTVAMINFDMIGHLGEAGLTIGGVGSSKEFAGMIERLSDGGAFEIKTPTTTGGSDHSGFYRNDIPFLFFHTGLTDVYHTPDDDFETIDVDGTVAAIDFSERVIDELLKMPERPHFSKIDRARTPRTRRATAYLGIVPDYGAQSQQGVKCTQVNPGSPAAKGDIKTGDVILKIEEVEVADVRSLTEALRKYKAGDKVKVVVRRDDKELVLNVTLGTPGG